jgi:hypothetical protein
MHFNNIRVQMGEGSNDEMISGESELSEWIAEEFRAWTWLLNYVDVSGNASPQTQTVKNIYNTIQGYFWDKTNDERIRSDRIKNDLMQFNGEVGPWLPVNSRKGQAVIRVREKFGDTAAIAAYSIATNSLPPAHLANEQYLRGILAFMMPAYIDNISLIKELDDGISKSKRSWAEAVRKIKGIDKDREAHWNQIKDEFLSKAEADFNDSQQKKNSVIKEKTIEMDMAIEKINRIAASYNDQMKLQAPVAYWDEKQTLHKKDAYIAGNIAIGYFVVALAIGCTSFYFVLGQFIRAVCRLCESAGIPKSAMR